MGAAGVVALISFIKFVPVDSELRRAMNPKDEFGEWNTRMKTNAILADLYDVFVKAHSRKGHKPKEYPRPRDRKGIGRDPIPLSEFWDWWNGE